MSLPRNPLIPTNSILKTSGKRQKLDDSPSTSSWTKSKLGYDFTKTLTLRSQAQSGGLVSIRGIDADIPLKNILSQVRGGAIERVTRANDLLVLCFLEKASALLFYKFARSGQFIVEGQVYRPEHPDTSMRKRSPEYEKALKNNARRVLKISRPVNATDCRLLYSKMNMLKMEQVFGAVGSVVCVQPMFCQNEVAFQIMFQDIESAIKAKKLFELKTDLFESIAGWSLSFSADPAEQGCYISP